MIRPKATVGESIYLVIQGSLDLERMVPTGWKLVAAFVLAVICHLIS